MIRKLLLTTFAAFLFSTAVAEDRFCQNDLFTIDARYDAGAFAKCKFKSDDRVELTIKPEDYKVVVEQPWFSFKVTSASSDTIHIRLRFPDGYARYWPKISTDGTTWERAAEDAVNVSENQKSMDLRVEVVPEGTWVSAQELITQSYYDTWLTELSAHEEIAVATIGMSTEGRPIQLAKTANKPEVILLLGRQHPAEVPGALAMRDFIDVVLGESELARKFRNRFGLLIVPLMNPDGVANGHWRHNAGRTDLNRDWGPFSQPETRSVASLLDQLDERGIEPRLMLDFHATKMSPTMIFYTQVPDDDTDPPLFASNWMMQVAERIANFEFTHDPRAPSGLDNTKNYFFGRYGIPAITYEIGDEADRSAIFEYTPVFAEEMMRVMMQAE